MVRERPRVLELAAAVAVRADELGVAERTDGLGPVLLAPAPQIAAGETQKHRRATGLTALPLNRQEGLLDRIGHRDVSQSRQPAARSSQAGQSPQP